MAIVFLLDGSNVALSMAAVRPRSVVATVAEEPTLKQLGLVLLGDMRGKTLDWLWSTQGNLFKGKTILNFQDPTKAGNLADYGIFAGALTMFVPGPSSNPPQPVNDVFQSLAPQSAVFGWGTDELALVHTLCFILVQ